MPKNDHPESHVVRFGRDRADVRRDPWYREVGVVPTVFNGSPGVELVLLEKVVGAVDAALPA